MVVVVVVRKCGVSDSRLLSSIIITSAKGATTR